MSASSDSHGWVLEAVDLYELPLQRYARRLLGDFDLASDVVQHAFLKLCEQSQAALEGRVAPWLFRVCRNRALDHLRQSGREHCLADDNGQALSLLPHRAAADGAADPSRVAEQRDLAARLRELLKDLPAPQRETIDLWCEGFTHKQIAEITGRTEVHVRVLAHRGLTALRSHPFVRTLLADGNTPPNTSAR
ncbi:MAG: RNA polymerase sigma factor [Planctomycetota bacterium]